MDRENIHQNKPGIDRRAIIERSFQVSPKLDKVPFSVETPVKDFRRIPLRNYRSTYPSEYKEKARLNNKATYQSRSEHTNYYPNFDATKVLNGIHPSDYTLRIQYPLKEYHQSYGFPNVLHMDNINSRENIDQRLDNNSPRRENWKLERDFEDGSNFQESSEIPINHETRSLQELSPISVTDENRRSFDFKSLPLNENLPVERESAIGDFSKSYQNSYLNDYSTAAIERNRNLEYDRLRGTPDSFRENIFEPRSQIIRYVFSAPRQNELRRLKKSDPDRSEEERKNSINYEVQKRGDVDSKGKTGIASIEVSELSHHKIRHHHGERPKRNYSRQ